MLCMYNTWAVQFTFWTYRCSLKMAFWTNPGLLIETNNYWRIRRRNIWSQLICEFRYICLLLCSLSYLIPMSCYWDFCLVRFRLNTCRAILCIHWWWVYSCCIMTTVVNLILLRNWDYFTIQRYVLLQMQLDVTPERIHMGIEK